jgi:hypothetical protein
MRAAYPVLRTLLPSQVVRSDDLAQAMVDVAVERAGQREALIFENSDIRAWAESRRSREPDRA